MPTWHAFSENSDIEFEIEHTDCFACAHKEDATKNEKKKKAGRTTHVRAIHVDGEEVELPSRKAFYEELYEKSQREKKPDSDEE